MLAKQFIGKWTWWVLGGVAVTHLIAILVRDTSFELPALIAIAILTIAVAWKSLPHGLMIAFAEVFTGGHGHLLDADLFGVSVSIRMIIFVAIMIVWFVRWIKRDLHPRVILQRDAPWVVLAVAIAVGVLVGFLNNSPASVFDDANGYVAMLYLLPIISINWTQLLRRDLLQTLAAGAIWLTLSTLTLSFLFTHLDGKALDPVYKFVRDSRLAEITLQVPDATQLFVDYYYRIFLPSQMFIVVMSIIMIAAFLMLWRSQRMPELTALSFALLASAGILSMSRSFLLGFAAASVVLFVFSLRVGKRAVSNVTRRSVTAILLAALGFGIAWSTVAFPFPPNPDISDASFYKTSAEVGREAGVTSRWQLVGPMMEKISESPIIGSGFGTEVAYTSDDPRLREQTGDGVISTYRFEWGYYDVWLKMGALGLIAIALYFITLMRATWFTIQRNGHAWLAAGLGASILALYIINIFSPYMNHPIGIMLMLFALPFIDFEGLARKIAEARNRRTQKLSSTKKLSPAVSSSSSSSRAD
ncbi:MAG: O-antigen ligase family protein [bacterium]